MIPLTTGARTRDVALPEPRSVFQRSPIDKAKAVISTIDFADWRAAAQGARWRKVGEEWVTRCVLPDHEDSSPSFAVNPDKNVWFCHGCLRGGDVVKLAQLAWGHVRADTAAADLLHTFGHEIPSRPKSWHDKQTRQERARRAIEEAKVRRVQRRIFRWVLAPPLTNIADEDERREEAGHAWEEAARIARLLIAQVEAS